MINHNTALDNLVNKLYQVGESNKKALTILKEPSYYNNSMGYDFHSLCDIIIIYRDFAVPLELKHQGCGSHTNSKGVKQLEYGHEYINKFLKVPSSYGVLAHYSEHGYQWSRI